MAAASTALVVALAAILSLFGGPRHDAARLSSSSSSTPHKLARLVRRVGSVFFALALSYYAPSAVWLATALAAHVPGSGARVIGAICIVVCVAPLAVVGWRLSVGCPSAEVAMRVAAASYEDSDNAIAEQMHPQKATQRHDEASQPVEQRRRAWLLRSISVLGWLKPCFDASRDPSVPSLRVLSAVDMAVAMAVAAATGILLTDGSWCTWIAGSVALVFAAYLGYLCLLRPYAAALEQVLAIMNVVLLLSLALASLALAVRTRGGEDVDEDNDSAVALAWLTLITNSSFYVQAALLAAVELFCSASDSSGGSCTDHMLLHGGNDDDPLEAKLIVPHATGTRLSSGDVAVDLSDDGPERRAVNPLAADTARNLP